jgi:predicted O-methyltransferase YrrM
MFITNPDIEKYLISLSKENDPVLEEMENLGHQLNFPIVDKLVGRFLYLITKLKNPELIVELGSGFGYSGYWFAKALKKGKVVLTEYKEENINLAKEFFKKGNLLGKAEFHLGDGIEIASSYKNIDILFLDLEKRRYIEAVKKLLPNLSENALIIADNVLWHGKVVEDVSDNQTTAIKRFNNFMFELSGFFTTIIPLRDGILISYKE